MNYTPYLLLACGFGGVLLHNLMKMDEINRKDNGEFKFGKYLKLERFSIIISCLLVGILVMIRSEIRQLEQIGNWLGIAFIAIGYMAQSILIRYMGKAKNILEDKN